jgi:hypothetical protein
MSATKARIAPDLAAIVAVKATKPLRRGGRYGFSVAIRDLSGIVTWHRLSARAVLSYSALRRAVYDRAGVLLPRRSSAAWPYELARMIQR